MSAHRRMRVATAAVLMPLLVTAVAWAAGEPHAAEHAAGHEAPGLSSLGLYIFNFALFLGLLVWRAKRPAADYLAERRATALAEIEKAQAARKEAEAALAAYRAKLAELEAEREAMLREAREMAEVERTHLLEGARVTAERIQREARFTVEQEIKRARLELEREVAHQVATQATRAVRDAMSDDDQARLVDEFVVREIAS